MIQTVALRASTLSVNRFSAHRSCAPPLSLQDWITLVLATIMVGLMVTAELKDIV
jgi:hypothetical protein